MGSHGIRDRVAIVGMGCTRFAEHWDKGVDDLLLDATGEAFTSAGVTKDDVALGGRVEMTFRKVFTADGIHNYFWKARPVRAGGER